ncbi:formate dehydrogenase subunit delta [Hyphobacterium marinum]|uniref:Formate dehydrogenase subunit delta n=1 Tax=Hyphobacterium marinum TaxID=3116574 RepID=A0ABU7LVV5_9PROT|nr:formate dehydrogenase subunit delta [Hyphobacterium sp. Y6023]MEE2565687.1 formate dehydrogenase subunit delta [Hyphobacterium sp. Y6023]
MRDEDLIRMARQIADFFEPYGHEETVAGIATHMRNFWDPRMRTQIIALANQKPDSLPEPVREAVNRLASPA